MKIPSLDQIWSSIFSTFKRFPLAFVASIVGTMVAIYAIENHLDDIWVMRALFTTSLSIFFFTALALFTERTDKIWRNILMFAGASLMGFYYFNLPEVPELAGYKFWIQQIFLCLASFIAIIWAPFWREKTKNELMWEWVRKMLMNLVETVFFGIVLFAGISAAIFAIKSLFNFNINEEIYLQIWAAIVGSFGPIYFLSHLSKSPLKLKFPKPIPAFMRILTKYILTVLAVGYFVILYAYTFKVLLTGEWPKNLLSWLVIGFSVVAVFAYFLWTPFWKEKIAKYRRLFWWMLLPQIFMLFIAIGWRIQAYSWTENRYFVVILGLWLLGITIYFLVNKKATFKSIFIALTAVILISQLGPLSGYSVGERAQRNRLIGLLENGRIMQNGEIIPAKIELDKQIRYEISDTIGYLVRHHGKESVVEIFPGIMTKLEADNKTYRYSLPQDITKELGFEFVSDWEFKNDDFDKNRAVSLNTKWNAPRKITGYDWFVQSVSKSNDHNDNLKLGERDIRVYLNIEGKHLEILENEKQLEKINFADFFAEIKSANLSSSHDLDPEKLAYVYDGENIKAKIYFPHISFRKEKAEYYDVQLYLSFK